MGAPSVDRIRALHFAPCSRSPLVEVLVVVEALIKFAPQSGYSTRSNGHRGFGRNDPRYSNQMPVRCSA